MGLREPGGESHATSEPIFKDKIRLQCKTPPKAAKDGALRSEGNHRTLTQSVPITYSAENRRYVLTDIINRLKIYLLLFIIYYDSFIRGFVVPERRNFGTYKPDDPVWESRGAIQ